MRGANLLVLVSGRAGDIVTSMEKSHHNGFTLIELMVTISIISIVLAFGIPWFGNVITENRMATQANELVSAIAVARSEAIKQRVTVRLCSSEDTDAENPTCAGSNDWAQGWLVYADANNDGVADAGEAIRVAEPLRAGSTLEAGENSIAFDSRGFLMSNPVVFNLAPNASSCQDGQARDIALSASGHPSVTKEACP